MRSSKETGIMSKDDDLEKLQHLQVQGKKNVRGTRKTRSSGIPKAKRRKFLGKLNC